jgi:hypothetical protein
VQASYLFPAWSINWIWDLISIMHSDEALLAIVFILFSTSTRHLKWDRFLNTVWLTGRLPEEMKHEHPLNINLNSATKKGLSWMGTHSLLSLRYLCAAALRRQVRRTRKD